ncbi:hypothetical protein G5714_003502 [Onychostoma macrolepis]|uniref:Uncharacterized protein n=1 Tax=Onychostoma macrolepis TaxID=369639 RepID=A0A7J6D9P2_9TELE|nr:hypothetical protein G5714_003502 [Onychostoma macrolepis]
MEDFQIEIPEFEIPEIEVPEIEVPEGDFCEMEMDYDLEMEDDNGEGIEDKDSETKRPSRPKAGNPKQQIQYNRQMQQNRQGPLKVQVKVKDYLRLSVLTVTFCNCLFLGTAALKFSLKTMEDFQIEIPEFEIPEIEVPEIEVPEGDFCEMEMDYDLEMEDDNGRA